MVVGAQAATGFRILNIQDEWATDQDLYEEQMTMLGAFFEHLYPEVPWFEKGSSERRPADYLVQVHNMIT